MFNNYLCRFWYFGPASDFVFPKNLISFAYFRPLSSCNKMISFYSTTKLFTVIIKYTLFYKQNFYKQSQAKIGEKLRKN